MDDPDSQTWEILDAAGQPQNVRKMLPTKSIDGFSRQDVVSAFGRAFTMIGGVQRLALWANQHPTEFYRLFSRLMPSTSIQFGDNTNILIQHAIPKSPLDVHDDHSGESS